MTTPVQSQKDDLESLGYMMVYFAQGKLPWQGLKASTSVEKDRLVMDKKMALSVEALCVGLPQEFTQYMWYVKSLKQGEKPADNTGSAIGQRHYMDLFIYIRYEQKHRLCR
jgi:hypothetical protein